MEAIDIVETLNKKFKSMGAIDGVHFILHKKITPNTIKAYKEYDYTLWYLNKDKKYQVKRIVNTSRVVTKTEEETIKRLMNEELLLNIYSIFTDQLTLKDMLNGEFKGYGI